MIESIFTFTLMFVLNTADIKDCQGQFKEADACYFYDTQTIYVQETTDRPQDFVLYHEIGHHVFKDNFDPKLFTDREVLGDQFGLFMYIQKNPYNGLTGEKNYPYKQFQSDERYNYFKRFCDQMCVDGILSIKLPNVHFEKPFLIRQ